jgi:hypothetical protein
VTPASDSRALGQGGRSNSLEFESIHIIGDYDLIDTLQTGLDRERSESNGVTVSVPSRTRLEKVSESSREALYKGRISYEWESNKSGLPNQQTKLQKRYINWNESNSLESKPATTYDQSHYNEMQGVLIVTTDGQTILFLRNFGKIGSLPKISVIS